MYGSISVAKKKNLTAKSEYIRIEENTSAMRDTGNDLSGPGC